MTSSPTAIGIETLAISPFCSAGPVEGSKYPKIIPMAIASKIHTARNLSRNPSCLKADREVLAWSIGGSSSGGVVASWVEKLEEGSLRPASIFFSELLIIDIVSIASCFGHNLGTRFIHGCCRLNDRLLGCDWPPGMQQ